MFTPGKKATRPCPCGYLGHPSGRCRCTPDQVSRYTSRLSGPLLDRIDMHIHVPSLPESELLTRQSGEASARVAERVCLSRARQIERQGKPNAALDGAEIDIHCTTDRAGRYMLEQAIRRLHLSARAYHRILKLARTLADLAGTGSIEAGQVAEAVQYRRNLTD